MVIMIESPVKPMILSGFKCSNNLETRIKCFVCVNCKFQKQIIGKSCDNVVNDNVIVNFIGKSLCRSELFDGCVKFRKVKKFGGFKMMVVGMECGFVEGFEEEGGLSRRRDLGRGFGGGRTGFEDVLRVSSEGEDKGMGFGVENGFIKGFEEEEGSLSRRRNLGRGFGGGKGKGIFEDVSSEGEDKGRGFGVEYGFIEGFEEEEEEFGERKRNFSRGFGGERRSLEVVSRVSSDGEDKERVFGVEHGFVDGFEEEEEEYVSRSRNLGRDLGSGSSSGSLEDVWMVSGEGEDKGIVVGMKNGFIEGFEEEEEERVLRKRNIGRDLESGSGSSEDISRVSSEGEDTVMGFGMEHGFIEGFEEGEEEEERVVRNLNLGRDLESGSRILEDFSSVSREGDDKVRAVGIAQSYVHGQVVDSRVEGFEENITLSKNRNLGGDLEGESGISKQALRVSRGEEDKVIYLEERDEEVLSKRILNLTRTNRRTSALVLFRSMEVSGLRPNLHACNSLLACLSRVNMIDDVLRVFAFMKRSKIVSGHSCSLVLKALAKHCGSDNALDTFSEWVAESEMNQHLDSIVYNTMISICGKENNSVQLKKIWKCMNENGVIGTTIAYRILVCTFVRCGQYEVAIDAYSEMLQNELEPCSDAMHAVIGACAKEEKWDMALGVFHNMLKYGLKPNLVACNALINLLGKAGKVKEAYNIYKHIRSFGHVPDSYTWNALLAAFYRANQYTAALQLFDSIQKDMNFKPSSYLYNTALMCCQRLRYWEKALQFLWKMEKSGIVVPTESYNLVISVCENAKKPKIALEIYEHMVSKQCLPDTLTRLSLIRSCIWGDLWEEVDNILDESAPDVSLYNAAIHGMCLKRKSESAKTLYLKMRDIGLVPDGKTRALMLQYIRRKS